MMVLKTFLSNNLNLLFSFCMIIYCTETRPQQGRVFKGPFEENPINISYELPPGAHHHHHHGEKTKTRILTRENINPVGFEEDSRDRDIIFPDAYQEVIFDPIMDNHRSGCIGDTVCEQFQDYPDAQIKDILKRKRVHHALFGRDETPEGSKPSLINRLGEEEFVCSSLQRTVYPRVGKNKNNKWKYIINQDAEEGYIQGVRIETCKHIDAPCAVIGDLPNGVVTSCKQKYIYRRLMSISNGGEPVQDSFMLPSACCCAYKRDVDFLARFGGASVTPAVQKNTKNTDKL